MDTPKQKLTLITGPMFSGKTTKLISIAQDLSKQKIPFLIIKPQIDTRYSSNEQLHSHDNHSFPAQLVALEKWLDSIDLTKFQTLLIDEVQFFKIQDVLNSIKTLLKMGKNVVAAGLLYDFQKKPFGATPELIKIADERIELFAKCVRCGKPANHSERIVASKDQIVVGAAESYIAVCERCHRLN